MTDVVETQREEYTDTALLTVRCYNNVEKKRSFYGVPYTVDVFTNHSGPSTSPVALAFLRSSPPSEQGVSLSLDGPDLLKQ